jgi:transcriptional regulator with XRE-family HTH domain
MAFTTGPFETPETVLITDTVKQYTGADLKRIRKKIGLGVEDMANVLTMSRTSLYRYEKARDEILSFPMCCALSHIDYIHYRDIGD